MSLTGGWAHSPILSAANSTAHYPRCISKWGSGVFQNILEPSIMTGGRAQVVNELMDAATTADTLAAGMWL